MCASRTKIDCLLAIKVVNSTLRAVMFIAYFINLLPSSDYRILRVRRALEWGTRRTRRTSLAIFFGVQEALVFRSEFHFIILKFGLMLFIKDADAMMNLGALYHLLGKLDKAHAAYKLAQAVAPNHHLLRENIERLNSLLARASRTN